MQEYLAKKRHLNFPEHVDYGGSFVISWNNLEAGVIVCLDISQKWTDKENYAVTRGSFDEHSLQVLKDLQEDNKDIPVLALHSHDGIRGMWHCIYDGVCYNVVHDHDIDASKDAILHELPTGKYVLLAIQGIEKVPQWTDTVPTAMEISRYQSRNIHDFMPDIVRSIEDENIINGCTTCATYGTEIQYNGKPTLIYIEPSVNQLPRESMMDDSKIPYMKSRVISSMSAAGYWHHSLRGTAFRAYLKGSYYNQTIWTGGVIGWMSSATTVPMYYSNQERAKPVRGLIIFGGYNKVDQVSQYNPDIFSEQGYKLICGSNTVSYEQAIKVDGSYRDYIYASNNNNRFHYMDNGTFLSTALEDVLTGDLGISRDTARTTIVNKLNDNHNEDAW
jgi:hypothetical protein